MTTQRHLEGRWKVPKCCYNWRESPQFLMYLLKTENKHKYTQSPGKPVETQRWLLGVFKKWAQFHGPPQLTHKQGQECQPHRHTEGRKSQNICKIIRNHCLGTKIAWTKSGINLLKWCWNISDGFFFFIYIKFNQLVALKENSVTDQKCGSSLSEEITFDDAIHALVF